MFLRRIFKSYRQKEEDINICDPFTHYKTSDDILSSRQGNLFWAYMNADECNKNFLHRALSMSLFSNQKYFLICSDKIWSQHFLQRKRNCFKANVRVDCVQIMNGNLSSQRSSLNTLENYIWPHPNFIYSLLLLGSPLPYIWVLVSFCPDYIQRQTLFCLLILCIPFLITGLTLLRESRYQFSKRVRLLLISSV